jgi:TolB-like protein
LRNVSAEPEESDYVADGITQAVITKLTQAGLQVTPWETAQRFRARSESPEAIASELGADAVLVGTFQLIDERILATLSLVDARTGFQFWADEFEEPFEDLFTVQRRIALGAATSLKRSLSGSETEALEKPESASVDAYDFYLQGSHLLQQGDREATTVALDLFQRAVELDPDLADAHVGLGAAHETQFFSGWAGLASLELAQTSYERAIQLDPGSMRARRGLMTVYWEKGHSEDCLMEGRRAALAGRSDDVETLLARATSYFFGGLPEEATPLYQEVLAIDPLNADAHFFLTVTAAYARNLEAAIQYGNAYLERFGDDAEIRVWIGAAHQLRGDDAESLRHYELASRAGDDSGTSDLRGLLLAGHLLRSERESRWREGLERSRRRLDEFPDNVRVRLYLASFLGLLGEHASFEAEERRALEVPDIAPADLRVLAAVHAALGNSERAIEILRLVLARGRLDPSWELFFELAGVTARESPAYRPFIEEFDAARNRLRQMH